MMKNQGSRALLCIGITIVTYLTFILTDVVGAPTPITTRLGDWVIEGDGFAIYDIKTDTQYLYLVGSDASRDQWRIEKRLLSDGSLVPSFGDNGVILTQKSAWGTSGAYALAIDGEFMYIVGYRMGYSYPCGKIEKRRLVDGSLVWSVGDEWCSGKKYYDIAVDSIYMYIVGTRRSGSSFTGYSDAYAIIEKRRLSDGALVTSFGSSGVVEYQYYSGSQPVNVLHRVAIDDNYIYAVGTTGFSSFLYQFMMKRHIDTGEPAANFGVNGARREDLGEYNDVAIDTEFIYVIGYLNQGGGDFAWTIERRKKSDGEYATGFGGPYTGRVTSDPSSRQDVANALLMDGKYLYIVGGDMEISLRWRIEKRRAGDGALDLSFGEGGFMVIDVGEGGGSAFTIAKKGNCIYVGGTPWRVQSICLANFIYMPLVLRNY